MSKETQRSLDRLDWDSLAADALELARLIPRVRNATRPSNWQACFAALPTQGD
ncbi:MAG: hypothetical protein JWP51_2455 [Bradyrhizobium sp.]|jgi:hypothetical protein|nr:hypothetical protein [Bradyrhizobium sp.]